MVFWRPPAGTARPAGAEAAASLCAPAQAAGRGAGAGTARPEAPGPHASPPSRPCCPPQEYQPDPDPSAWLCISSSPTTGAVPHDQHQHGWQPRRGAGGRGSRATSARRTCALSLRRRPGGSGGGNSIHAQWLGGTRRSGRSITAGGRAALPAAAAAAAAARSAGTAVSTGPSSRTCPGGIPRPARCCEAGARTCTGRHWHGCRGHARCRCRSGGHGAPGCTHRSRGCGAGYRPAGPSCSTRSRCGPGPRRT